MYLALLNMVEYLIHVTSFSSIAYWSNSDYANDLFIVKEKEKIISQIVGSGQSCD